MEDIEKGVETAELWVERLRIAAVDHYARNHITDQDLLIQKKNADYVRQAIIDAKMQAKSTEQPIVKIHAEEMSESESAFMLEQGQMGLRKVGRQLGPLAGWLKDIVDNEYGPDWQVIVGKKGSFGSCLSPMAGHYINFSVDSITFLIFRAS